MIQSHPVVMTAEAAHATARRLDRLEGRCAALERMVAERDLTIRQLRAKLATARSAA